MTKSEQTPKERSDAGEGEGGRGGGPKVQWERVRRGSEQPDHYTYTYNDWEWIGRDDQGVLWGAKRL